MIGYVESEVKFETTNGIIGQQRGRSRSGYSTNFRMLKQDSITNAACIFLTEIGLFTSYDEVYDELESYKVLSSSFIISRMTAKKHLKVRKQNKIMHKKETIRRGEPVKKKTSSKNVRYSREKSRYKKVYIKRYIRNHHYIKGHYRNIRY